ncbi:MAG: 4Fe-4S ferredoxin [Epsilonproteobacteria bacterium]|nr:4Fe-4S ferredoxin [Campylobacterota bacterium]|tara:strand:+ start:511 stop:711 length:201 start_codon:yes stop_codon:yes gene_type:complete
MKKVNIIPGCITCGTCEFLAPEVFEVLDIAYVKDKVDFKKYEKEIKEACKACPVGVIKYSENKEKP